MFIYFHKYIYGITISSKNINNSRRKIKQICTFWPFKVTKLVYFKQLKTFAELVYSIIIYIHTIMWFIYELLLVLSCDLSQDTRTVDVIYVVNQSVALTPISQPITLFVLYRSRYTSDDAIHLLQCPKLCIKQTTFSSDDY